MFGTETPQRKKRKKKKEKKKKRPGYHLLYSLLFSQSYYKLTKKILKALYLSQLAHLMWFKILNLSSPNYLIIKNNNNK